MKPEQDNQQYEELIVTFIEKGLENGTLNIDQARKIAESALTHIDPAPTSPEEYDQQTLTTITTFPELKPLTPKVGQTEDPQQSDKAIGDIHKALQDEQINDR